MKKGTILITLGLLLIAAALGLTGYNLWDNQRAGKISGDVLEQLIPQVEESEIADYLLNPDMDMPAKSVESKEYVGVLSIPAIDRELPVFNEWNYDNLQIAPCRYYGTAYQDNMVICAHNYDTHFGPIKTLNYGDSVIFTDMDGNVFRYEVEEVEILQPTEVEKFTHADADLTLFTCTIGGQSRVTVRCQRMK
ncbi:MAG: sortase [Clostridiales bacterium]|nr:sortase [Candidatus Cacconaster stercorequi]